MTAVEKLATSILEAHLNNLGYNLIDIKVSLNSLQTD